MKAQITVPGSTSNLGASFDTCGLALSIYLRVVVEENTPNFQVVPSGEGAAVVPRDETNLIARVARYVSEERSRPIGGVRLRVDNQIPLARGLGSSSAAIVAGISLYEVLSGERLTRDKFFRYALHFEEHGDNLAPGLLGGLVVTCIVEREKGRPALLTLKRDWPLEVKVIAVVPNVELETARMRQVLPTRFSRPDTVFNVQRAALLQAALSERRFDLLGEALRDRIHQPYRAALALGLGDVLALNDEADRIPGLLGVALSGAGSTIVALAIENYEGIAQEMVSRFDACGVRSHAMHLEVDNIGRRIVI